MASRRNALIGLATALLTAAGAATAVVVGSDTSNSSTGSLGSSAVQAGDAASVGVLRTAPTVKLPAGLDYAGLGVADPEAAVILRETSDSTYYAAAGKDGEVCLVVSQLGAVSGTCSRFSSSPASANLVVPLATWPNGVLEVGAVARDGVATATVGGNRTRVANNFFVTRVSPGNARVGLERASENSPTYVDFSSFIPPAGAIGVP